MEIHVAGLVLDNDIGMGVAIVEELSGGFGCFGALHRGCRGHVVKSNVTEKLDKGNQFRAHARKQIYESNTQ